MKIFQTDKFPFRGQWIKKDNWAIELNGQVFYGALSQEQLEDALKIQETKSYFKEEY